MGIPRLSTFVKDYFAYWETRPIRGKLVLDGSNVLYSLHNADWSNGGQYREFRSRVREFYSRLQRSGITPIVIFDGVDEEQKTDTLMKRKQEWVDYIQKRGVMTNSSRPLSCRGHILPLLTGEVYRMVLHDLGIQFYVADREADVVIARVANYYSCPVLSLDSDFFIFRLVGGYILFDNFYWQQPVVTALVYHREKFATQLNFQDINLLFAIPAIVGNDFLPACSSSFISGIMNTLPNGGDTRKCIQSICLYLSQFSSLEQYTASAFGGKKQELRCYEALQWYNVPTSLSCEELVETTVLQYNDGSPLPQWLITLFHQGHVPSAPITAIVEGKIIFRMIPDNFQKESSIMAGEIIRKHMYALLGCENVLEFYRHGLHISGVEVSSMKLDGKYSTVTVSSVQYLPQNERQSLFYTIMQCDKQCDKQAISKLTGPYHDWKFVAATASLWAQTTSAPEPLVKALLLCFMICSGFHDEKLRSLNRTFRVPVPFRKSQQWLDVLHLFVKWQVIYHDAWTLNALLMEPMRVFSPAFLYDGEIAMYLASAENIDQLVFAFNDVDINLYRKLKDIVLNAQLVARVMHPAIPALSNQSLCGRNVSGDIPADHTTKIGVMTKPHKQEMPELEVIQGKHSHAGSKVAEHRPHEVYQPVVVMCDIQHEGVKIKKNEAGDEKLSKLDGIPTNHCQENVRVTEAGSPHEVHVHQTYVCVSKPVKEEPKQEEPEKQLQFETFPQSVVSDEGPMEQKAKSNSVPKETPQSSTPSQVRQASPNKRHKRRCQSTVISTANVNMTNSAVDAKCERVEIAKNRPDDYRATELEGIPTNHSPTKDEVVESNSPDEVHQPSACVSKPDIEEPKQKETEKQSQSVASSERYYVEQKVKSKSVLKESPQSATPSQVSPAGQIKRRKRRRYKNTATSNENCGVAHSAADIKSDIQCGKMEARKIEIDEKTTELQGVQAKHSPTKDKVVVSTSYPHKNTASSTWDSGSTLSTEIVMETVQKCQNHEPKSETGQKEMVPGENYSKESSRHLEEEVKPSKTQGKLKYVPQESPQSAAAMLQMSSRPANHNAKCKRKRSRCKNKATQEGGGGATHQSEKQSTALQSCPIPKLQNRTGQEEIAQSKNHNSTQDRMENAPPREATDKQNGVQSDDRSAVQHTVQPSKVQGKSKSFPQKSVQSSTAAAAALSPETSSTQNARRKRKHPRHKNTATPLGGGGAVKTSKKVGEVAPHQMGSGGEEAKPSRGSMQHII